MAAEKMDFVNKLLQIEEQANALSVDLTLGLTRARLQHIIVLAKTLRSRLELGSVTLVRADLGARPVAEDGKPSA
jgi:hypothetical protein